MTEPDPIPTGWRCEGCGAMLSPYIAECPGCAADPDEVRDALRLCALFTEHGLPDGDLARYLIDDDHGPLLGMPLAHRIECLNLRHLMGERLRAKDPAQLARERRQAAAWLAKYLTQEPGIPKPPGDGTEGVPEATE